MFFNKRIREGKGGVVYADPKTLSGEFEGRALRRPRILNAERERTAANLKSLKEFSFLLVLSPIVLGVVSVLTGGDTPEVAKPRSDSLFADLDNVPDPFERFERYPSTEVGQTEFQEWMRPIDDRISQIYDPIVAYIPFDATASEVIEQVNRAVGQITELENFLKVLEGWQKGFNTPHMHLGVEHEDFVAAGEEIQKIREMLGDRKQSLLEKVEALKLMPQDSSMSQSVPIPDSYTPEDAVIEPQEQPKTRQALIPVAQNISNFLQEVQLSEREVKILTRYLQGAGFSMASLEAVDWGVPVIKESQIWGRQLHITSLHDNPKIIFKGEGEGKIMRTSPLTAHMLNRFIEAVHADPGGKDLSIRITSATLVTPGTDLAETAHTNSGQAVSAVYEEKPAKSLFADQKGGSDVPGRSEKSAHRYFRAVDFVLEKEPPGGLTEDTVRLAVRELIILYLSAFSPSGEHTVQFFVEIQEGPLAKEARQVATDTLTSRGWSPEQIESFIEARFNFPKHATGSHFDLRTPDIPLKSYRIPIPPPPTDPKAPLTS